MGDTFPKIKLAAVQAAPVFLNREASVEKACRLIRETGAKGANFVGFPENFIPGHPNIALVGRFCRRENYRETYCKWLVQSWFDEF